ncbi:MAG TPA: hypothetical protein VD735_00875, partial [Candidatus Saccharimonadales bacterium]|nr:hypothetical protein [Candidatus Saccharimonadales bacterium]
MMPICDGVGFLRQARLPQTAPNTKVVLLTNLSTGKELEDALVLGAHKTELKANLNPRSLIALVRSELAA